MQTVKASVILDDLYRLMAWDSEQLEDSSKQDARMALSLALQEVWEAWWWEELMTCEQLPLRTAYDGLAVTADTEVYYPGTYKYYTALVALTPGYSPAVDEYNSQDFTPNPAWREAALRPEDGAEDYDLAELDNYEAGDLVRNPEDGLLHQFLGTVTASGAGVADVNGTYVRATTASEQNGGRPVYLRPDGGGLGITWGSVGLITDAWLIYSVSLGLAYYSYDDVDSPDQVTTWLAYGGATLPGPTAWTTTGIIGTAYWAQVTAFEPTLEINRKVRSVSRLNPRQTNNPGPYEFHDTVDGIELVEIPVGQPWIWARRVTPVLTGDEFSATATYAATAANELVYDS